jgi:small subunit ribosomal protein S21
MAPARLRPYGFGRPLNCSHETGPNSPLHCYMGTKRLTLKEFDGSFMQIIVRDNNVEQALRALKKKLQREGVYREMKLRRHYEKPSEKRARERAAAIRRARKLERKRAEREGAR